MIKKSKTVQDLIIKYKVLIESINQDIHRPNFK